MKMLAWNVMGLNHPRKQNGVKKELVKSGARVIGLFETKFKNDMCAVEVWMRLHFPGWRYSSNFHLDHRGRVLVMWDPCHVDLEVIGASSQHIGCIVTDRTSGERYGTCFVYGLFTISHRSRIWEWVEQLMSSHSLPWIVLGDFNNVMRAEERINGRPVDMRECRDMLAACQRLGLEDAHTTNSDIFTWSDGKIWSRIDRVLINDGWHGSEVGCHVHYVDKWFLSDHKLALVSVSRNEVEKGRAFKFHNMWAEHEEFMDIVSANWRTPLRGTYQFRLCALIRGMKAPLRELNRLAFSHISTRAATANEALSEAMNSMRLNPESEIALRHLESAKKESERLNKAERTFLGQQAKATYVLQGDRCTRYFHALMKANGRRDHIASVIRRNGTPTTSEGEVASEFIEYFQGLFGSEVPTTEPQEGMFAEGPSVTEEDCGLLVQGVSNREIKEALHSIDDTKAPGPDGFSSKFFKATWEVTGGELCAAVKEFFANGKLLRQLNHTTISLIPKSENPSRVEHYRPISCCNVVYKIISKIMAKRLGGCLGYVIDPVQAAFVAGRAMTDNIFLVQELLRRYNVRRDTKRCFLNIDLAKAYDTITWPFLRFAMRSIGLPQRFIEWVMECVTSASYSVKVNHTVHGHFIGKRGLRQGDPLSPLLFVICMEFLTRLIRAETDRPEFHYHQQCEQMRITHLMFADDVVLFCRGDVGSVRILMGCLRKFEGMSGLAVSVQKSAVYTASVPEHEAEVLRAETGFGTGTFPFRYLGIPISPHGLRVVHYQPLLDKMRGLLNAWSRRTLSFAGRRELIASVLQGVAGFWLGILPVPDTVLKDLETMCRSFLWRWPKVRWTSVCKPRREGGLGLIELRSWNQAFMAKHLWHIVAARDSLWIKWIRHKYLQVLEPKDWLVHRTDSLLVKAILRTRDRIVVLEGANVELGEVLDGWCTGGKFRVSAAYEALREHGDRVRWHKEVWSGLGTPKHGFILWLAVLGRLSTYDRMWFLDADPACPLCSVEEIETHEHVFFQCSYAGAIWSAVRAHFRIPNSVSSIPRALRWLRRRARTSGCLDRARVVALSTTVYYIWRARNVAIFDEELMPIDGVIRLVLSHIYRVLYDRFPTRVVEEL